MEVGARLKEARMEKGLSLDSLQETTKIQKRYLEAIEEGNFHILPGKFYARAFIKEYANAVGINPDELLEEHKSEIPESESEEESETRYTRIEKSRRENSNQAEQVFSILPKIIVGLLIVGILGAAIWFYFQSQSSTDPTEIEELDNNVIITNPNEDQDSAGGEDSDDATSESNEEEANEATEEESENDNGEVAVEVVEVGTGSPPESILSLTNPNDELIFSFSSEASVWLDVTNGNSENFYNAHVDAENSPVTVDLTGQDAVHLNIGSTPNLRIQINGVDVDYPIDPNERDHQRLILNIE